MNKYIYAAVERDSRSDYEFKQFNSYKKALEHFNHEKKYATDKYIIELRKATSEDGLTDNYNVLRTTSRS